jgi:hypothetical protein
MSSDILSCQNPKDTLVENESDDFKKKIGESTEIPHTPTYINKHFLEYEDMCKDIHCSESDIHEIFLTGSHYDLAKIMFNIYGSEYRYTRQKIWYRYNGSAWVIDESNRPLYNKFPKISDIYMKAYKNMKLNLELREFNNKRESEDDNREDIKKLNNERISRLKHYLNVVGRILIKLKTSSFKMNILRECDMLFLNFDLPISKR